jgi:hypothetical protein
MAARHRPRLSGTDRIGKGISAAGASWIRCLTLSTAPESKRLRHPVVGDLALTYQSLSLPTLPTAVLEINIYTAEPGTPHEEHLKLLSSWAATSDQEITTPGARSVASAD